MTATTASEKKEVSLRKMCTSVDVCRNPEDGTAPRSGSIAVGAELHLHVEDALTTEAVKGAMVRRITINSEGPTGKIDWVSLDPKLYIPYSPPQWVAAPTPKERQQIEDIKKEIQKNREEIQKVNKEIRQIKFDRDDLYLPWSQVEAKFKYNRDIKEKRNKLLDTNEKLLNTNEKLLNTKKGYTAKLLWKGNARRAWVKCLQSILKVLNLYDGPLNGVMSPDFANDLTKTYKQMFNKKYEASLVAKELYNLIKEYITDENGDLKIPLPLNEIGTVEVEFHYFKVVDPEKLKKLNLSDTDFNFSAVYKGSGFSDPADQPGSREEESGWVYVTKNEDKKEEIHFQNFIKIGFKTSKEVQEPERVRTRALVWCQPAFTAVDKKFISDPEPPIGTRGHPNRGMVDIRPTTLVCNMANNEWSKKYGEYGNEGRKSNGKFRLHRGVDIAGKEGDPLFALNGGKILRIPITEKGGQQVTVETWIPNEPIQEYTYLHLVMGSLTVKEDQIIKAGDIVGKMGRTPGGAYFPSVSPTHVHFLCGNLNIQSDNKLGCFLEKGFKAVFPNNAMPKILPCGEEYKDLQSSIDPVKCHAKLYIADTCWALRELACPSLPKTIKVEEDNDLDKAAVRKIQAQLIKLGFLEFKSGGKINIDGNLGPSESFVTVKSSAIHKTVFNAEKNGTVIFKAQAGEKFDLIRMSNSGRHQVILSESHVLKYQKDTNDFLAAGMTGFIHPSQVNTTAPGATRQAVRRFREAHMDKCDPPNCYHIDQKVVDKLEELAPLKLETPS